MSWVTGVPLTLAQLVELRPGLSADHQRMQAALWTLQQPSPVTLELCRLRIAHLVGAASEVARRTPEAVAAGLTEARIAALSAWPTDQGCTEEERASLALAEQVAMDAHGVTEDDVHRGRTALGDEGLVALMIGLAVFEGTARAAAILGAAPDERLAGGGTSGGARG